MARKTLIRSSTLPYHVTARTNNRETFHSPLEEVWRILSHQCLESHWLHDSQIHAFVLMPNHFHMLLTTPTYDLGLVMREFMRSATATLNRDSGRSGRVFGARYHWSLIDSSAYFTHAFKYVYRNPVTAGLCSNVEDWSYSTLFGMLGNAQLPFPVAHPVRPSRATFLVEDTPRLLDWLNQDFQAEQLKAIRKGLKKTQFQPPKNSWRRNLDALLPSSEPEPIWQSDDS